MSKQRSVRGTCTYCGRTREITDDHVPPQNIFPSPRPPDLITVPACRQCNQGSSREDEYFRIAILGPAALHDPRARKLWDGPVVRGLRRSILERKASFAIEFEASLREFEERDSQGRVIGVSRARMISKERLDPTVERIVRGLLSREYDEYRPSDDVGFNIEIGLVRNRDPEGLAKRLLHGNAVARSVATGIFQYWHYAAHGGPNRSDWLLTFYRTIGFRVRLIPAQRPPRSRPS